MTKTKYTTRGLTEAIRKFFTAGGLPYSYTGADVEVEIDAEKNGWTHCDVGMALMHMARRRNPVIERVGEGVYRLRSDLIYATPILEKPAPRPLSEETANAMQKVAEKPRSKKYDAWAGAHPVVGTEAWTLVNATSEALCREVVWRLVTDQLPESCTSALLITFSAMEVLTEKTLAEKGGA
jgi:hypothetical protein